MQDNSKKIVEGDLINLRELIKILWSSKILVIVITMISISCGYFYGSLQTPSFKSTAQVLIGNYGNKKIINAEVLKIYYPDISISSIPNPLGGEFISLSLSNAVSSERAEIKMQKAVDYLLNTSNAAIQEKIDDFKLNNENEIKALDLKIDIINQEIDRLSNLDKTLESSHGIDTTLTNLIISKTMHIINIEGLNNSKSSFQLSKILNEVISFKVPQRSILVFVVLGLIFGIISSFFLAVIKKY